MFISVPHRKIFLIIAAAAATHSAAVFLALHNFFRAQHDYLGFVAFLLLLQSCCHRFYVLESTVLDSEHIVI
jgi:hypothetical protein